MPSLLTRLPGWAVDNRASVFAEAAEYRDLTPEQRLEITGAACRAAAKVITLQADPTRALEWRDPLPRSSVEALRRLRAQARERRNPDGKLP